MAYEDRGLKTLDYKMCRYGRSKLTFRGPAKSLDGEYIAFVGGTETFGKFVPAPFPDLVEAALGIKTVNLGCMHAGPDAYLNDPKALDMCNGSIAVAMQVPHASNISNRYFSVHPRRNDRFLRTSTMMQSLYHDLDFTEFAFVRHMLSACRLKCEERFEMVVSEMQSAWVSRMRQLIGLIGSPTILFSLQNHHPKDQDGTAVLGSEPLFVHKPMLDGLEPLVHSIHVIEPSVNAVTRTQAGMIYPVDQTQICDELMGPETHYEVAEVLGRVLKKASQT